MRHPRFLGPAAIVLFLLIDPGLSRADSEAAASWPQLDSILQSIASAAEGAAPNVAPPRNLPPMNTLGLEACAAMSRAVCDGKPWVDFTGGKGDFNQAELRRAVEQDVVPYIMSALYEIMRRDPALRRTALRGAGKKTEDASVAWLAKYLASDFFFGTELDYWPDGDLQELINLRAHPAYRIIELTLHEPAMIVNTRNPFMQMIAGEMFPKMKHLIIQRIEKSVAPSPARARLLSEVKETTFSPGLCLNDPSSKFEYTIFKKNAFNMPDPGRPGKRTVTICPGMFLSNSSKFHIAHVLAHEIAHSLDPCTFVNDNEKVSIQAALREYPLAKQVECLASPDSAEAPLNPQAPICRSQHLREGIADLIAVDVLAEFLGAEYPHATEEEMRSGYASLFRSVCTPDRLALSQEEKREFLDPATRMDSIVMARPKIRAQIGCSAVPAPKKYCGLGQPTNTNELFSVSSVSVTD